MYISLYRYRYLTIVARQQCKKTPPLTYKVECCTSLPPDLLFPIHMVAMMVGTQYLQVLLHDGWFQAPVNFSITQETCFSESHRTIRKMT